MRSAGSSGAATPDVELVCCALTTAVAIIASIAASFSSSDISSEIIVFALTPMFVDPLLFCLCALFNFYVVLMFSYYTPHIAPVYPFLGVKIPTVSGRFTPVKFTDFEPKPRRFYKTLW